MRNPNGYGGVRKLKGKRRRPYAAVINKSYETVSTRKDISFLECVLDDELYKAVQQQYYERVPDKPKATRKQQVIGYYETRQDALIALAEYNKSPYDLDKRTTTFSQIYELVFNESISKMSRTNIYGYKSAYDKCTGIYNVKISEIRKAHMQSIIDEYSSMSKSTQNNLIKLFHLMFDYALENDIVEKNYSSFVSATSTQEARTKQTFTRDEIRMLWDNIDTIANTDTVLIMIYTGMRIGELLSIKCGDVHIDERYIALHGTKTKAAERIVPLHKSILQIIQDRLKDKSQDDLLIDGMYYQKYRVNTFDVICNALNMQHTPHECRHTFATFAASNKLNPILVKKIIGHSAQDLTQDVYTHVLLEDLIAEIDKLEF